MKLKTKLEGQKKSKPELGDVYEYEGGGIYIICSPEIGKYSLICLSDGGRWVSPPRETPEAAFGASCHRFTKIPAGTELVFDV